MIEYEAPMVNVGIVDIVDCVYIIFEMVDPKYSTEIDILQ